MESIYEFIIELLCLSLGLVVIISLIFGPIVLYGEYKDQSKGCGEFFDRNVNYAESDEKTYCCSIENEGHELVTKCVNPKNTEDYYIKELE